MCAHVKSSSRSCFLKLTTLRLDCLGRGRGFLQRQNLGMNYPLAHFYFSSEIILAQSSLGKSLIMSTILVRLVGYGFLEI